MENSSCYSSLVGSDFRCLCSLSNERQSAGAGLHGRGYSQIKRSFNFFRLHFQTNAKFTKISAAATTTVASSLSSNRNRDKNSARTQMYSRLNSCLVLPPSPSYVRPRAIIKFLGGAFIGAVPEVTYRYLIEQLAKDGFLVILVPYNVTFDHSEAANQVYHRFNACYNALLNSGFTQANLTPDQLADLPLFSVGHSNGALLQLLTGSYFSEKLPKANVIISYNNRPATEAVPYFEQLGPVVNQVMPVMEASPLYSIARSASGDAWKVFLDVTGSLVLNNEKEALTSLNKFADQLPSVLNQVAQGVSEFRPTPSENRDLFLRSYNVQHTLLVKFNFDTIDETDILEETLRRRVQTFNGTLEKVELSGNHITPCIQEPKWEVSDLYTPVDAVAQGLKSLSLSETRNLSRTISNWFRRFEN